MGVAAGEVVIGHCKTAVPWEGSPLKILDSSASSRRFIEVPGALTDARFHLAPF